MGDHDALFKHVFAVPAHAADELRSVLPPQLVEALDLEELELLSGVSVSDQMDARFADLLFRAPLRATAPGAPEEPGGLRPYAYIHVQLHIQLEHQSRPDLRMPLRVHEYTLGFWRELLRAEPHRKTLPPVITLVVHHGPRGWNAPRSLHDMVEGLDAFPVLRPYVPDVTLLVDDLAHADDAQLLARPMAPVPKVAVWLLRDGRQVEALLAHIPVWKDMLQAVFTEDPDVAVVFVRYISLISTEQPFEVVRATIVRYIAAAEAPLATIAEQLRQEGLEKGRQLGFQEGRQEGRQEGADVLRRTLRTLLEQRFGSLDAALDARLAAASLHDLEHALTRVMLAAGPFDVFVDH